MLVLRMSDTRSHVTSTVLTKLVGADVPTE